MTYFFRRRLTHAEQWPAVAAGIAAGAAAFYIASLLLQREPLRPDDRIATLGRGDPPPSTIDPRPSIPRRERIAR